MITKVSTTTSLLVRNVVVRAWESESIVMRSYLREFLKKSAQNLHYFADIFKYRSMLSYFRFCCALLVLVFTISNHACLKAHTKIFMRKVVSSGTNAFVCGAGGLRFKSRAGQIGHGVATAAAFFRKKLCCPDAMTRRWALQTRYTLRRNTGNVMKDLI